MYNAAIDRYEWNKLQGKNRYVAQLHSRSSRSGLCTEPPWSGGVCTQANLIQVYFIHAYLFNCNKIPQISNPERKMEKKVRNNISKRPGEMCSGERSKAFEFTGVISEIENKVATITTLCIRDETNKWIQFRNICSIYFQYWCQHFS